MAEANKIYSYFKYDPAAIREIQKFYVPMFGGKERVLDVACGRGEFLELLRENGIAAIGVDRDADACRQAAEAGVEVVKADVFHHLAGVKEGTYDGIFMSHFLEHITYEQIEELFRLCERALLPDGILVAVVPSVSSTGMHLDWFYRDPTHFGWRHPLTLSFYLEKTGFVVSDSGGNPNTKAPYLGDQLADFQNVATVLSQNQEDLATLEKELTGLDDDLIASVKASIRAQGGLKSLMKTIGSFFMLPGVKPYVDEIARREKLMGTMYVDRLRGVNDELLKTASALCDSMDKLDHSFEDYVLARKGTS